MRPLFRNSPDRNYSNRIENIGWKFFRGYKETYKKWYFKTWCFRNSNCQVKWKILLFYPYSTPQFLKIIYLLCYTREFHVSSSVESPCIAKTIYKMIPVNEYPVYFVGEIIRIFPSVQLFYPGKKEIEVILKTSRVLTAFLVGCSTAALATNIIVCKIWAEFTLRF